MSVTNIYLIGLPGAGKSTIAKALSEKYHMDLIDIDEFIKESQQQTVQELFAIGENHFRQIEHETLISLDCIHTIISTGGGIILDKRNQSFLKEQPIVIYLNRSLASILETLDTQDRPLFNKGASILETLYHQRHSIYLECATFTVDNNDTIENCVSQIDTYLKRRANENTHH